jgi:hypothetical protein
MVKVKVSEALFSSAFLTAERAVAMTSHGTGTRAGT